MHIRHTLLEFEFTVIEWEIYWALVLRGVDGAGALLLKNLSFASYPPGRLYVGYNEEVILSERVVFYRLLGDMWVKLSHIGIWDEDPAGTR